MPPGAGESGASLDLIDQGAISVAARRATYPREAPETSVPRNKVPTLHDPPQTASVAALFTLDARRSDIGGLVEISSGIPVVDLHVEGSRTYPPRARTRSGPYFFLFVCGVEKKKKNGGVGGEKGYAAGVTRRVKAWWSSYTQIDIPTLHSRHT